MIFTTEEFLESERDRLIHDLVLALYHEKSLSLIKALKNKPLAFDLDDFAEAIAFRESVIEKMARENLIITVDGNVKTLSAIGRGVVESGGWLSVVQLRKSQRLIESERVREMEKNNRRNRTRIIVTVIAYLAAFVAITLAILAYFRTFRTITIE